MSTAFNRIAVKRVLTWLSLWLASAAVISQLLVLLCSVRIRIDTTVYPLIQPTVVLAQVYWADHRGEFSERRSRRFRVGSERDTLSLEIPSSTDAVRIDPLEQPGTFEITRVRVTSWATDVQVAGGDSAFGRWEPAFDVVDVDSANGVYRARSVGLDPQVVIRGLRPILIWHWVQLGAALAAVLVGSVWLVLAYGPAERRTTLRATLMRQRRPAVLRVMAVTITVLLLESGSALGLWMIGKWPSTSFEDEYRAYIRKRQESLTFGSTAVKTHPYFGFRFDPDTDGVNNYGFHFAPDFPVHRQGNDFVIGVFGGSVAESFAYHADRLGLLAGLSERIPELKHRPIKVVNFSLAAGKQPQQFFIASYFVRDCDLLVNIDGFNDAWFFDPRVPSEFPWSYPELYESSDRDRALPRIANRLTDDLTWAVLDDALARRSAFFFAVWRIAAATAEHSVADLSGRLARHMKERYRSPAADLQSAESRAAIWGRFTKLEDAIARAIGRRALFFLQPNQYVRPAKPFSPEERRIALADSRLAEGIEGRYRALQDQMRELRRDGVLVFDLTDAFAQEARAVYTDSCCHVNLLGNRILADRIMASIVDERDNLFSSTIAPK